MNIINQIIINIFKIIKQSLNNILDVGKGIKK